MSANDNVHVRKVYARASHSCSVIVFLVVLSLPIVFPWRRTPVRSLPCVHSVRWVRPHCLLTVNVIWQIRQRKNTAVSTSNIYSNSIDITAADRSYVRAECTALPRKRERICCASARCCSPLLAAACCCWLLLVLLAVVGFFWWALLADWLALIGWLAG